MTNNHDATMLNLETECMYLGWLKTGNGLKRWLRYSGEKSIGLFAPSGMGKQTDHQAYATLTNPQSMVINSPKGEDAYISLPRRKRLGHETYVVNPFALPSTAQVDMTTARYNPMAAPGMRPDHPNFSDNVGLFGGALILPDGGQSFFVDSARNLCNGVVSFVCTLPEEHRNLVTVNEILQSRGEDFLGYMMNMRDCGVDMARHASAAYLVKEPPRDVWSTLSTASTQIGQLMAPDGIKHVLSGSDFSWPDAKERKVTIYICLPEAQAKTHYRFTRLLFASAFQALLTLPRVPVWFILDELATSLGDRSLDQIETAMSLGRGYGLKLDTIFQSYAQMDHIFGKGKAQAMLSSMGVQLYYTVNDEITASLVCRRAGEQTQLELRPDGNTGRPISTDAGAQEQPLWMPGERAIGVPLYRPQDLYALPRNKVIVFKEGVGNPIEAYRTPYWQVPELAALAAPNPYAPKTQQAPSPAAQRRFWSEWLGR